MGPTESVVGKRIGQGEQARSLLVEHVDHAALGPARVRPRMRDGREELDELRVAVLHGVKRSRREEAFLEVADRALDLALLLGFSRPAERGLHVKMRGEIEQRGVEANGVARALEDDGLRVVEEPLTCAAPEERGGAHQRATQRVDAEVDDELGPHRARVREDHDEGPERPVSAGHGQRADVRPVDLRLLAGQRLDAQEHLVSRRRPRFADIAAQRANTALVAALDEHVVDARRDQPRIARQRLVDEGNVRLEHARVGPRAARLGPEAAEHADHDIEVHAELRGDRAAFPVLREIQPTNLRGHRLADGHRVTSQSASWRRSRKSPRPRRSRRRRRPRRSPIATPTS